MLCLIFIYFFHLFCCFRRVYTEKLKTLATWKKVWGWRKDDKYPFKCEIYFMPFNNGNFSWNRLIGYPVVLQGCSSQELRHPEKDITCCLDISCLPSSSTSVWLFNNSFLCYKKYTHTQHTHVSERININLQSL